MSSNGFRTRRKVERDRGLQPVADPFLVNPGFTTFSPTAAVDYSLKQQRWQLACATLCGYLVVALLSRSWLAGIAGGISAMVCSWLANQSWQPER